VLAADSDALLAVDRTAVRRFAKTQKNILKLVHPGIGKQQGVVPDRHNRPTWHKPMSAMRKEINKAASNVLRGQHIFFLAEVRYFR
jgi:hypothetical protein